MSFLSWRHVSRVRLLSGTHRTLISSGTAKNKQLKWEDEKLIFTIPLFFNHQKHFQDGGDTSAVTKSPLTVQEVHRSSTSYDPVAGNTN